MHDLEDIKRMNDEAVLEKKRADLAKAHDAVLDMIADRLGDASATAFKVGSALGAQIIADKSDTEARAFAAGLLSYAVVSCCPPRENDVWLNAVVLLIDPHALSEDEESSAA